MTRKTRSNLSDEEIIAAVNGGDYELFRLIVERYQNLVAGVIFNMIRDRNRAEDIGQEVFIRLYKSLGKFKGEAKLSTYISRIAINLSLNEIKKEKKKWERYTSDDSDLEFVKVKSELENIEMRDALQIGMRKLIPEHKTVIILRYIEGFSTKETSDILEIPQGTVLSRLSRGLELLRKYLNELGFEMN